MITRDPAAARSARHDLVVIGGGVHGCMVAHQASLRGLRVVLLERGDFGQGTSWNSLRILHGGLRYLQSLDLARFRESVRERQWFFDAFPHLVRPLPCLMPLSGARLHRPTVLRAVLAVNERLSAWETRGEPPGRRLPAGRVLNRDETAARLPEAVRFPVRGGALWYDGLMVSPPRILVELLARTCRRGSLALNHVEARSLLVSDGRVAGVGALDVESGAEMEIRAPLVVNAAGPLVRVLARRMDREVPGLFHASLAFNLLLERKLDSEAAVAVHVGRPRTGTLFLLPFHGRTLAGTFHEPVADGVPEQAPMPGKDVLERAVDDLNGALPGFDLTLSDIVCVLPGYLPADGPGSRRQARRPVVVDHGSGGGPVGLWSLSGVKFTTARAVADRTLNRMGVPVPGRSDADAEARAGQDEPVGEPRPTDVPANPDAILGADAAAAREALARIVREEAALHLDDLLLRRLDGLRVFNRAEEVGRELCRLLGWESARTREELTRLRREVSTKKLAGHG